MEWIAQNWLWVVFGIFCVGMHMFGHGGHNPSGRETNDDTSPCKENPEQSSGSQH